MRDVEVRSHSPLRSPMSREAFFLLAAAALSISGAAAQAAYAGMEARPIKALSEQQVADLKQDAAWVWRWSPNDAIRAPATCSIWPTSSAFPMPSAHRAGPVRSHEGGGDTHRRTPDRPGDRPGQAVRRPQGKLDTLAVATAEIGVTRPSCATGMSDITCRGRAAAAVANKTLRRIAQLCRGRSEASPPLSGSPLHDGVFMKAAKRPCSRRASATAPGGSR